MELNAINRLAVVRNSSILRVARSRNGVEALGQLGQLVAVRHPHLDGALDALEQAVDVGVDALGRGQLGGPVLAVHAGDDVVLVQAEGQLLLAVADAQDRYAQVKEGRVGVRRVGVVDGVRAAAEDEADGLVLEVRELGGAGQHLGVDVELAQAANDPAVVVPVSD